ncbi:hypothetical protein AAHA92_14615 [Salvia divinorum]|uniref:Transposase MuDR plant domain-containing protein n=1 Tax=Salvia divinorum TaxID=28513 RepID=A0ABD1HC58_SALDI
MDEEIIFAFVGLTLEKYSDAVERAVKQHTIKTQFELGIEKSNQTLFRVYCKAKSCQWSIVARLMKDEKQIKVSTNKGEHFCSSTGRLLLDYLKVRLMKNGLVYGAAKEGNWKSTSSSYLFICLQGVGECCEGGVSRGGA